MKQTSYFLFFLLFSVLTASAQTNGTGGFSIKGQVIDSLMNESVPYATLSIALASQPQKPVKLLACNENGDFESALSAGGTYILSIQSIGKAPTTKTFTLTDTNKSLNLGKVAMSENNERLGEVTVTAQKPLVKVDIDKITYNLEEDPEAKTSNSLEMLRKVPMVTVDGEDNIQLKGSGNFKIYMNGKPSNMLSSNNASDVLKSMPASSIKNIEVITDPGAKYDAEGIGGIINIITTKNALQGYTGTVRADASSLGRLGTGANLSLKAGKLGLTGNFNIRNQKSPWNESEERRETFGEKPSILTQKGETKFSGPFQFGSLEASYEIDSLNLISVGANRFNGKMDFISEYDVMLEHLKADNDNYAYLRNTKEKRTFGSTDINVDYQHSTHKKEEMLTLSYKFSNSPNDNETVTELSNLINYPFGSGAARWDINDAFTNEHTAQLDYTTPTRKDQSIETGVKYILRQNNSEATNLIYSDSLKTWNDVSGPNRDFKHTQHIYSGYLGYTIKHNKFGYKAGVRGEGTALNAKYVYNPEDNFNTDYFDIVPNATVSYQINMAQQIRLGYNLRIQRPGIWYLNPYVNTSNPENISYGNPDLASEKSHNINVNYSMFSPKFNINFSTNYTFVNNAIEQYQIYNGNVIENTFDNIGKRQQIGTFIYGRWNPIPLFTITLNGGVNYVDFKSELLDYRNNGFNGRLFSNAQISLPKNFRIDLYGGGSTSSQTLQGSRSGFKFVGIGLNKSFLEKKLNVTLSCNSPFWKTMQFDEKAKTDDFETKKINHWSSRDVSIRVSYTFGTLKESIKKARRGITNDDVKSGGSQSGEGGGQGA